MKEMTEYGFSLPHRRLICPRLSEYEEHFPDRFATKREFEELRSTNRAAPESPAASQRTSLDTGTTFTATSLELVSTPSNSFL